MIDNKKYKISTIIVATMFLLTLILCTILTTNQVASAEVLKVGSKGETVKALQKELKNQGYYSGKVDGVYGNGTKNAVRKMQKAYGLTADGIAGNKTLKALNIATKTSNASGNFTDAETYLLAKTIYAEARGEPYVGKVAVGAVILNRVKSSKFPNTISGVVYQPWAFTAVHDGQINLEPNDECKRAAKDAIDGWDPTYGCLYYYNPKIATSKWIFSTKTVTQIGKHVFSI